jgi:serine phosphatase RsbU (regulator of sigma subunit)
MPRIELRIPALAAFLALALTYASAAPKAPPPAAASVLSLEELGRGTAPLDGPWQFHLGDNAQWADPAMPDATGQNGWEQLTADQPWGAQGHPSYAGFAWYRRHLHLTVAAGAAPDFALLIPSIDDAYEVYWNGRFVGRFGALPPHPLYFFNPAQQTFGLGPARDGVLALRVWKQPLTSFDPAEIGGFEATPLVGSSEAIAGVRAQDDYSWMRSNQFRFALWSLYSLAAVLGFFIWLRSRGQRELLALAVYCGATAAVNLDNLRLLQPYTLIIGWEVLWFGLENVGLWFLLLYLFNLDESPQGGASRVARFTRSVAIVHLTVCTLDMLLTFCWNSSFSQPFTQTADGILTAIFILMCPYSLVLVGIGIFGPGRKGRLDASRWLLAAAVGLDGVLQNAITAFDQGKRIRNWHIVEKLRAPLFTLRGNSFAPRTITGILLFAAIVYAVYRRVREATARQAVIERELQSARELQQVLIPDVLPELEGYKLSSAYFPAQEVGGDFFQVIPLEGEDSGSTLLVLGDVSGKGLKAAMAVSLLVGALRTLAEFSGSPAQILAGLNPRLHGRLNGGFATCVVLRLDPNGHFTAANAGHLAPLVNGRELDLPGALPLGILPAASYEEHEFQLEPGQLLTLLTDGVVEAQNTNGELFGFDRTAAVSTRSAEEIAQAAKAFGQQDDITVLTLAFA